MTPLIGILVLLVALVLIIGVWLVSTYNGLVAASQNVANAWAQIEVQLKRRHDLIPNLVNTVKGYAAHEKETFDRVISARAKATSVTLPSEVIQAEQVLGQALGRLLAVAEAYPELKANQNFQALQEELTSTENRVAYARQFYNDQAAAMNVRVRQFPTVLVAGIFGYKPSPLFETPEAEKSAPVVQF